MNQHSFQSTEFLIIMWFMIALTFNQWLQIPKETMDIMVYIVGGYTLVRQGIKLKNGIAPK